MFLSSSKRLGKTRYLCRLATTTESSSSSSSSSRNLRLGRVGVSSSSSSLSHDYNFFDETKLKPPVEILFTNSILTHHYQQSKRLFCSTSSDDDEPIIVIVRDEINDDDDDVSDEKDDDDEKYNLQEDNLETVEVETINENENEYDDDDNRDSDRVLGFDGGDDDDQDGEGDGSSGTEAAVSDEESASLDIVEAIKKLCAVGDAPSVNKADILLNNLFQKSGQVDAELSHSFLRTWASCYDSIQKQKVSKIANLIKQKVIAANYDNFEIILNHEARWKQELASSLEIVSQMSTVLDKVCQDAEQRQQFDECAKNVLIQVHARFGSLQEAMTMAKSLMEDIATQDDIGLKLRDETFVSILIAAIGCQEEERSQVTEFLSWAGEQYERDDNLLEVKVGSIYLFGRASQMIPADHQAEMPVWLLESINWIGKKVQMSGEGASACDYEKAIELWCNAGETRMAKALLEEMFQTWEGTPLLLDSCNTVLASLAVSRESNVGSTAKEILALMNSPGPVPNFLTYALTFECLLKSEDSQAAPDTLKSIARKVTNTVGASAEPTFYASLAYRLGTHKDIQSIERLSNWLDNNGLLSSLGKHFYWSIMTSLQNLDIVSADTTMLVLDRAVEHARSGKQTLNQNHFEQAMACLEKSNCPAPQIFHYMERVISASNELLPGQTISISWKMLDAAIGHNAKAGEAEKVEALVSHMYQIYIRQASRVAKQRPTVNEYNSAIEAWSNSAAPKAAKRADAIVQHMHEIQDVKLKNCKPNKLSYELLLDCWSKSSLPEAKQRQEEIKIKIKEFS